MDCSGNGGDDDDDDDDDDHYDHDGDDDINYQDCVLVGRAVEAPDK